MVSWGLSSRPGLEPRSVPEQLVVQSGDVSATMSDVPEELDWIQVWGTSGLVDGIGAFCPPELQMWALLSVNQKNNEESPGVSWYS